MALLPASFRGVPFAVVNTEDLTGRRVALHVYPGRDDPWAEDMGRAPRAWRIRGFLLKDDQVYGGGPIVAQKLALKGAAEAAGAGTLVHPTEGVLSVSCRSVSFMGDLAAATMLEIALDFIESGKQQFPSVLAQTSSQIAAAVGLVQSAISGNFSGVMAALTSNATALINLPPVVAQWTGKLIALAGDATALLGLAAFLPGNNGRYSAGANDGFTAANASPYATDVTITDLIADASAKRSVIAGQVATLESAITGYGTTTSAEAVTFMVQALVGSLVAACANPADSIRLLGDLIEFGSTGAASLSDEGQGFDELFRRTAVAAMGAVASTYQPKSYNDAFATLQGLAAVIDDEITIAGDAGQDDTFTVLRALRVAVVTDLRGRGASLSPIKTFRTRASLPSLVMAQRFYRDASRADELVKQVDVPSPLFMPTEIEALAA